MSNTAIKFENELTPMTDKDFEQIQGYIGLQALYDKKTATTQLRALKEIS